MTSCFNSMSNNKKHKLTCACFFITETKQNMNIYPAAKETHRKTTDAIKKQQEKLELDQRVLIFSEIDTAAKSGQFYTVMILLPHLYPANKKLLMDLGYVIEWTQKRNPGELGEFEDTYRIIWNLCVN